VAVKHELQAEQEFVDLAYARLDAMRSDANRMLEGVLDLGKGGTFQSRTERDVIVRTSLARLEQLDIGDQALTFGRIDRVVGDGNDSGPPAAEASDGLMTETFHIGRLAVHGADHEPLVVDWRAPVAEPFYRATGRDPLGLVLRRHLALDGRSVVGVEDEWFAVECPGLLRRRIDRAPRRVVIHERAAESGVEQHQAVSGIDNGAHDRAPDNPVAGTAHGDRLRRRLGSKLQQEQPLGVLSAHCAIPSSWTQLDPA